MKDKPAGSGGSAWGVKSLLQWCVGMAASIPSLCGMETSWMLAQREVKGQVGSHTAAQGESQQEKGSACLIHEPFRSSSDALGHGSMGAAPRDKVTKGCVARPCPQAVERPCHALQGSCGPCYAFLGSPGLPRLFLGQSGTDNCKLSLWASLDNPALGILASTLVKQAG